MQFLSSNPVAVAWFLFSSICPGLSCVISQSFLDRSLTVLLPIFSRACSLCDSHWIFLVLIACVSLESEPLSVPKHFWNHALPARQDIHLSFTPPQTSTSLHRFSPLLVSRLLSQAPSPHWGRYPKVAIVWHALCICFSRIPQLTDFWAAFQAQWIDLSHLWLPTISTRPLWQLQWEGSRNREHNMRQAQDSKRQERAWNTQSLTMFTKFCPTWAYIRALTWN